MGRVRAESNGVLRGATPKLVGLTFAPLFLFAFTLYGCTFGLIVFPYRSWAWNDYWANCKPISLLLAISALTWHEDTIWGRALSVSSSQRWIIVGPVGKGGCDQRDRAGRVRI